MPSIVFANKCSDKGAWLQVLGSGGPEVQDKRASSSYIIWLDGKSKVLIDAGGGSALRFGQADANVVDLDVVLFSHLHIDHSADFPALIKSSFFENRKDNLAVYGPKGNQFLPSTDAFVQRLFSKQGVWPYLNNFLPGESSYGYKIDAKNIDSEIKKETVVIDNTTMKITSIPVHHGPLPSLAWRVDLKGIGSVSFSGDMSGQYGLLPKLAEETDILVAHHAIAESTKGVGRFLHMPPSVIAQQAIESKAKSLVLSHRMLRSLGKEVESLAIIKKDYLGKVSFAKDLSCYEIKDRLGSR